MWKKILNIIKNPLFILALILIVGLVLRLLDISKTSFWYDEAFTGDVIKLSWKEMFSVIAADKVHPPLFYILIRLWSLLFGVTQFSLRSFSIFFGISTIVTAFFVGKSLFNKNKFPITGIVLALIVAISPFFVAYSIEARAYSLLALLALGLAYSTLKLLDSNKGRKRTKLLISTILLATILCGTHYLQVVYVVALVLASMIYKFVFTKSGINKKCLYLCLGFVLVSILFFLFFPLRQIVASVGIIGPWWVPEIKLYEVVRIYYSYFLGVVRYMQGVPPVRELIVAIPTLVFGGIMFGIHTIGYILILISKRIGLEEKRKITFFFFLSLITFLGFYILGAIGFNSFVERYTIAGGILLLASFWMVMSSLLKNWYVLIPIGLYVVLILMLKPMQTLVDYRDVAKDLDALNNVQRYVFTQPGDLITTQFYMHNQSIYYYYEYEGEYINWALIRVDSGLKKEDVQREDILIVPEFELGKFLDMGFKKTSTISGGFSLLQKE